ncbi:MAG: hypothetical protein JWO99_659 [Candidatus Saccharibacteria bacterium]|nr:hypothetical protein [Candidatus Saccharibacteria bacterium]
MGVPGSEGVGACVTTGAGEADGAGVTPFTGTEVPESPVVGVVGFSGLVFAGGAVG